MTPPIVLAEPEKAAKPVAAPKLRFDDPARIKELIAKGKHRNLVGNLWETHGQLQFDLLIAAGMLPKHRVLDLGCGCLRAGVKIAAYLEENHYYGIDPRLPLLNIGFSQELRRIKLSRDNLFCSSIYEHGRLEPETIDYGLCISVLTHSEFNHIRIMLENSAKYFKPKAKLFVSFLELPEGEPFTPAYTNAAQTRSFGSKPQFHYYLRDMEYAAQGTGWTPHYVGDWNEPNGQALIRYEKI